MGRFQLEGGHHRPDLTFVLESLIHETWAYVGDVGLKWARARDKHTAATAGKMEAAEVTKDKSKNYSSGLKRVNKLRKENQLLWEIKPGFDFPHARV